jgi:peptidoglycan/LPS O-acetylase OafA/YrhL
LPETANNTYKDGVQQEGRPVMTLEAERTDDKQSLRIPALDGLRGMAILLVLIYHYFVIVVGVEGDTFISHVARRLSLSWSGVDLFFVLSGFLIGGILIDNKESINYFKVFYIRRTCRIFPLYFSWIALFLVLTTVFAGFSFSPPIRDVFSNPLPIWSYLTFTQNIVMSLKGIWGPHWFAITWSLAIEEQFYLLLPLIIRFAPRNRLPYVLMFGILAAPIIRVALYNFHPNFALSTYVLMPCRTDSLLLGVLGAYLVRHDFVMRSLKANILSLYGVLLLLVAGVAILTLTPAWVGSMGASYLGYSWLALTYMLFLLISIIERRGIVTAISTNKLLRKLGNVSYGVYLFHQPANRLCHGIILKQPPQLGTMSGVLTTLLALLVTLIVAYLSYTFFEKKFLRIGHSFRYVGSSPRVSLATDAVLA